jgi:multidrug efflux pump subunit AcrA (membrane-fusion protein)
VARVTLTRGRAREVILLPREAVLRAESGYVVYVVAARDGQAVVEARPVVTGAGDGQRVVIEEGLSAGERVVVVGQQQVAPGDRVNVTGSSNGGGQ